MHAPLTRASFLSWLPWLLLLGVTSLLQLTGRYASLRLNIPTLDFSWVYTSLTCHLVHVTPRHYLYNALALLIIAWLFAREFTWPTWLLTFCLSALCISGGLLGFSHGLRSYAGLSGVLHGLFASGCLLLYSRQPRLAIVLGVLLLFKLLLDHFYGSLLLSMPGFTVVSSAHLYGVIGGVISWVWISLRRAH
jgi:rhomboid family GlyGly-CTERM serine protease